MPLVGSHPGAALNPFNRVVREVLDNLVKEIKQNIRRQIDMHRARTKFACSIIPRYSIFWSTKNMNKKYLK